MTAVHFLRHADAGDPLAWTGPDSARPLSGKGEKQAERLGRFLEGVRDAPDVIISSPKLRARQTAEVVAGHLGLAVSLDDRLASGFDLATVEAILRDAGDPARPVLTGHDPDFSEIVGLLIGSATLTMKKGAMARIDIDRPLVAGAGVLGWLVPPDLLGRGGR